MSVVKSDLIKELSVNYPNFLKKDLVKIFEIAIYEMQEALLRGERVELREVFSFVAVIKTQLRIGSVDLVGVAFDSF